MPDAPAPSAELPFENRSLFSDHFLRERLPAHPAWPGGDVDAAWGEVRALWERVRERLPGMKEAQTEEEWIRPVLRVLGWSFDVQPPVRGIAGTPNAPDYALFTDEARQAAAAALRGDEARYWGVASVVADAKYWGRSLDVARGDARELSNANPSFQVIAYLFLTGVSWAVLTNGSEWRLYSARARSRVDTYFAVDLGRLLEEDDAEGFRWFARFFGASGFRADPVSGRAFVDDVLGSSAEYGRAVEVRLKKLIFERVFGDLAEGFVDHRRRKGLPVDGEAELDEVYRGTLRLLYRILFLLHAEARDLLPVRERGYGHYSLMRARRRVVDKVDTGDPLSSVSTDLWNDLESLFRIVDEGDPGIGVPRYDGGLFRAGHPLNRFLAEHAVADRFLYPALDRLSRDADGHWIDYKALDVEQLGSLYEGLLEFRLRLVDGRPVLENDAGERHATGSYYTPHWVVEYIVEETVKPVLEAREAEFRAVVAECGGPGAPADAKVRLQRAADRLLSIRVCDPAMGSGHFLVHAANWLTERLIAILSALPENPVLEELARIREEIQARLREDGIEVGEAQLRDTALLKRLVIKRSIYGVDLNPMATELAKLSLWLDSFTVGAPLSFLDHHLKHGNSLVGTRVLAVSRAMESTALGQFDSFGGPFAHVLRAAEMMLDVVAQTDATAERVAESALIFAEFEATMAPYKRLLDLWVSRDFGNARAAELVGQFGNEVLEWAKGRKVRFNKVQLGALAKADSLREEVRFFHWDLEFPEVFVDLGRAAWKEDGGFDAVIGNPPYVRQEQVKALKPYFASAYADVHDGAADLYVYFYREGMELLRPGGRLSFIVTNKWLRAGYGAGLRRFFSERAVIERIVDFGHAPIFPDADVFPCIVVVERPGEERARDGSETMVALVPREALGDAIGGYVSANAYGVPSARFGEGAWSLEPAEVQALMDKIRAAGVPLREYAGVSLNRGVVTGLNEAFLIDTEVRNRLVQEDSASEEIILPYLRGQDIERWTPAWAGLWMIFARRGIEIDRYPAVKRHLARYRKQLEPKPPRWKGEKWMGRKEGTYQWYELQDPIAYWEAFSEPKIVYQEIQFHASFAIDEGGYLLNNKAFFIPTSDAYLLSVLNSPLMWWFNWRYLPHMKDEALNPAGFLMEHLPIANPTSAVREEAEASARRLIELTRERREAHAELMDWLRTDQGIDKPGQKLEAFDELSSDDFVAAVRDRRPKKAPSLGPRQIAELRKHHADYGPRLQKIRAVAGGLERKLAHLVNQAYGLTEAEVELMWRTAPPRMPVGR